MILRVLLLGVVGFLGCLAFYSRVETRPGPLARLAARKTGVLVLWVGLAFGVMTIATQLWIDP